MGVVDSGQIDAKVSLSFGEGAPAVPVERQSMLQYISDINDTLDILYDKMVNLEEAVQKLSEVVSKSSS